MVRPDPKTTAGRRENTTYTFLDDALDYLRNLDVLGGRQYAALSRIEKLKTVGSSTVSSARTAGQLHRALTDAMKAGEGVDDFRQRIKGVVNLARADSERILRTHTKTAFVDGMTKTLEKPHIDSAFGYVLYVATHDGRTRDSHRDLDGFVVKVGTREFRVIKAALTDWNCRCSLIPLNEQQAKKRTIKTYSDLPAEVLGMYGNFA